MNFTKIDKADLNYPCRELFVRGLGFAVALSVFWSIDFVCACIGDPIQLFKSRNKKQAAHFIRGY